MNRDAGPTARTECEFFEYLAAHRGANAPQRCLASDDPHFRDNNPPP